jgi:hypothetical protein
MLEDRRDIDVADQEWCKGLACLAFDGAPPGAAGASFFGASASIFRVVIFMPAIDAGIDIVWKQRINIRPSSTIPNAASPGSKRRRDAHAGL